MSSALDGITVLDLSDGMAGAIAGMFLADNGARVIRVDRPGGENGRGDAAYAVWDRGKESVFLDLSRALKDVQRGETGAGEKSEIGRELSQFDRLVMASDVLLESFAPSSAFQTIVDYRRLSPGQPRLVHCSITAYGKEGPLKDQPADDDLAMAHVGVLANLPSFRPGPVHVVHRLPSLGAGVLAAQGIAAALYAREKTGAGRKVDTSLMAGALLFAPKVSRDEPAQQPAQRPPQRATVGGGPFYSAFECEDGAWVQLGCVHNRFVQLAAGVLGVQDAMTDPKFGDGRGIPTEEAREELFGIVANAIKTRPYEEWSRLFEEADVPYAPVLTTQEAMDDVQVRFSEMVMEQEDPALGAMSYMGLPVKLSGTPGKVRGGRPVPGQHTDDVLSALSGEPQSSSAHGPLAEALPQPLDGVKVVETANVIAGPTAGKLLAVLGAEVIKLEPPEGDISRPPLPAYFSLLNSNKRSISVNARTEEGKEIVTRIAAQMDVLVANMRPGATERIGIGAEAMAKLNPGMIEAHVTAFGWTGPYAHRPGLDPLAQALMGMQRAQGGPENPPVFLGSLAPNDYLAGAMGAMGAIMALYARERGGSGQHVYTSLMNAGAVIGSMEFLKYRGKPDRRYADKGQHGLSALHRLYETAAGWIYLAAENEKSWPGLCEALDREDLAGDPRFASPDARADNDSALAQELERTISGRASDKWLDALRQKEVPSAPVVEGYGEGFFSDPQVISNDMVVEHRPPSGEGYKISRNLIRFANTSELAPRHTPLLGEQTREVLEEVGYSESEIDELYSKDVVKTA